MTYSGILKIEERGKAFIVRKKSLTHPTIAQIHASSFLAKPQSFECHRFPVETEQALYPRHPSINKVPTT